MKTTHSLAECCRCGELREVFNVYNGHRVCGGCLQRSETLIGLLLIPPCNDTGSTGVAFQPYPFSLNYSPN